jgi:CRP-like cAMP-binding protein
MAQEIGPDPLAEVALLQELDAAARRQLAARCRWETAAKGDTVLDRADRDRDLVFCVDGAVEVTSFSLTGREVAFARLGPGSVLGELAALDGGPRSASAIATAQSRLARLPRAEVSRLLHDHPRVAWRLLEGLAGVIRRLNDRVIDLNTQSANQRVIRELLQAARPSPVAAGQQIVEPAPTQASLAARADTTRETVARVLGELRDGGLVTKRGRCLTLHDPDTLQAHLEHLG